MVRIRLSQLDSAVKAFLATAEQGETIVVEDDDGRVRCGVTPYVQASAEEKKTALEALNRLQEKSSQAIAQSGVSEADVDRVLQD